MSLVTLKEILAGTRENQYAVGAFNFSCPEDAEGIIMAGVEKNAPVILMVSMNALKYNDKGYGGSSGYSRLPAP